MIVVPTYLFDVVFFIFIILCTLIFYCISLFIYNLINVNIFISIYIFVLIYYYYFESMSYS